MAAVIGFIALTVLCVGAYFALKSRAQDNNSSPPTDSNAPDPKWDRGNSFTETIPAGAAQVVSGGYSKSTLALTSANRGQTIAVTVGAAGTGVANANHLLTGERHPGFAASDWLYE